MWLLSVWPDHERLRAFDRAYKAHGCGHRPRDERQLVPLRYLQPDSRRHQGRVGCPREGSLVMNEATVEAPVPTGLSRRNFLVTSGATALVIGFARRGARGRGPGGVTSCAERLPAHYCRRSRYGGVRFG